MTLRSDMANDLENVFFQENTDEFNDSAVWTPPGGAPTTVYGYFNESGVVVDVGETGVESTAPTFLVYSSKLPGVKSDDAMVISSQSYRIVRVDPEEGGGPGTITLILSET